MNKELYIFSKDDELLTILSEETGLIDTHFKDYENLISDEAFVFNVDNSAEYSQGYSTNQDGDNNLTQVAGSFIGTMGNVNSIETVSPINFIEEENQIAFYDRDNILRMMRIKESYDNTTSDGSFIKVVCEPAYLELYDHFVEDRRVTQGTAQTALNRALEGSRYIGEVTVSLGNATDNFYWINGIEAIWKILNTWGGALKDTITLDGNNNITQRKIMIAQRLGSDKGLIVEPDYNAESISRKSLSYTETALWGQGASLETEGGGNTRYITFEDVVWKTSNGDPTDKPLGQKWVGDPQALADDGLLDNGIRLHKFGQFSNQDYDTPEDLLMATWLELQERKLKEIIHEATIYEDEKPVSLGDTVTVISREYTKPIELQSQITGLEYDILDDKDIKIIIGKYVNMNEDPLQQEVDEIKDAVKKPVRVTDTSFPDIKPGIPMNVTATGAFQTIQVFWDYDSNVYISNYEVYASKVSDFVPDTQFLVYRGDVSAFSHEVATDEMWYYYVRAVNTRGTVGEFSSRVSAETVRVITDDILFGAITSDHIKDLAITAEKIAKNGVERDNIADGAVNNVKLGNLAVEAEKLANGSVVNSKIFEGAVGTTKLADLAVKTAKIDDAAINEAKIANLAVGTAAIQNAAITNAKIDDLAVERAHIQEAAIGEAQIGKLAVGTAAIQDGAITNLKVGRAAIDTLQVKDGAIDNAKIKDLAVDNAKIGNVSVTKLLAGTIDTDKIKIRGGSATDYTLIDGSYFESRGRYTRNWRGSTKTHDVRLKFENGYLRARNEDEDQSIYFSDFGISTYANGVGDERGPSSGTLEFFSYEFSDYRGITLHSNDGIVGLKSETNRIVIEATHPDMTVDIPGDKLRTQGVGVIEPLSNLYLGASGERDGEVRITDKNFYNDGNIRYMPIRASEFKRGDGMSAYINGTGSASFVASDVSVLLSGGIRTIGTHFYIGVTAGDGGELRVTSSTGYNEGGSIGYRPVRASNFHQASSIEYKTNIENVGNIGLETINALSVLEYDLIGDIDNGVTDNRQLGFIAEYSESVASSDNSAIDIYKLSSYNTLAIQELSQEVERLKELINNA